MSILMRGGTNEALKSYEVYRTPKQGASECMKKLSASRWIDSVIYEYFHARIPYRWGVAHRYKYFKNRVKRLGKGVSISHHVRVLYPEGISFGDFASIANSVILDGKGELDIGSYAMIGFGSIILSSTHRYDIPNVPYRLQGSYRAKTVIGRNVWLGARVVILPGVNVGENCIVGANVVVSHDVKPNTIVTPPRPVLREIDTYGDAHNDL